MLFEARRPPEIADESRLTRDATNVVDARGKGRAQDVNHALVRLRRSDGVRAVIEFA